MRPWLPLVLPLVAGCAQLSGLSDYEVMEGGAGQGASGQGASGQGGAGTTSNTTATGPGSTTTGSTNTTGSGGGRPDCSSSYSAAVLCDKPIAYLRFENPEEPLADTMGQISGIANGVDLAEFAPPAIDGRSLRLTQNDHADFPDPTSLHFTGDAEFSVEVWVAYSPTSNPAGDLSFLGTWDGGSGWALFAFPAYPGGPSDLEFKRNAAPNILLCSDEPGCDASLSGSSFRHVVVTYDGDKAELFVDGEKYDREIPVGLGSGTFFQIQGPGTDANVHFDELAIYDYELPSFAVDQHFECGTRGCP